MLEFEQDELMKKDLPNNGEDFVNNFWLNAATEEDRKHLKSEYLHHKFLHLREDFDPNRATSR